MRERELKQTFLMLIVAVLVAALLSACGAKPPMVPDPPEDDPDPVEDISIMPNPTFVGAEDQIPPPGWSLYRPVDENRKISVINSHDPENRALLIEDFAAVSGQDGEAGLSADAPGKPGKKYRAVITYRGVEGQPTGQVNLQVRFLPSGTRYTESFNLGRPSP